MPDKCSDIKQSADLTFGDVDQFHGAEQEVDVVGVGYIGRPFHLPQRTFGLLLIFDEDLEPPVDGL